MPLTCQTKLVGVAYGKSYPLPAYAPIPILTRMLELEFKTYTSTWVVSSRIDYLPDAVNGNTALKEQL